jgi:hypothetical protein
MSELMSLPPICLTPGNSNSTLQAAYLCHNLTYQKLLSALPSEYIIYHYHSGLSRHRLLTRAPYLLSLLRAYAHPHFEFIPNTAAECCCWNTLLLNSSNNLSQSRVKVKTWSKDEVLITSPTSYPTFLPSFNQL